VNIDISPAVQRNLRRVGYPLFYVFALFLFVRCTFPYDRIGQRAAAAYNLAEAKKTGRRLEIEAMRGYWLFGIRALGVEFIGAPPKPDDEGTIHPARVVRLDRVYASVAPLRYLMGRTRVSFGANAEDGSVVGKFQDDADERQIGMELTQMGVENIPLLGDTVGLPMMGQASGKLDLVFPEKRLSLAEGSIELGVDNLEIGDGKTKIRGFIALPKLQAGRLDLVAEVQEGRVKIEKLVAKGPDFEAEVTGQVRLRDQFERSIVELAMRFKFADRYKLKNEVTKGLFGDPKKKIKGALEFDPKVSRAKESDGTYSWRIHGTFANLTFEPAPRGATRSRTR
jgi:type II secretion system protein N